MTHHASFHVHVYFTSHVAVKIYRYDASSFWPHCVVMWYSFKEKWAAEPAPFKGNLAGRQKDGAILVYNIFGITACLSFLFRVTQGDDVGSRCGHAAGVFGEVRQSNPDPHHVSAGPPQCHRGASEWGVEATDCGPTQPAAGQRGPAPRQHAEDGKPSTLAPSPVHVLDSVCPMHSQC